MFSEPFWRCLWLLIPITTRTMRIENYMLEMTKIIGSTGVKRVGWSKMGSVNCCNTVDPELIIK